MKQDIHPKKIKRTPKTNIWVALFEYAFASSILGLPCACTTAPVIAYTNPSISILVVLGWYLLLARFKISRVDYSNRDRTVILVGLFALICFIISILSLIYFAQFSVGFSSDSRSYIIERAVYGTLVTALLFGLTSGLGTISAVYVWRVRGRVA